MNGAPTAGRIAGWVRIALLVLAMAAPSLASPVGAADPDIPDIFIGTLANEGNDLVLTRCDIGDTRYVLVDAQGSKAVADTRNAVLPAYGEVIGSYTEMGGHAGLKVQSIDNLTPGRNCHLGDAATSMFEGPPQPSTQPEVLRARWADTLTAATVKYLHGDYAGTLAILRQAENTAAVDEEKTTDILTRIGFAMVEVAYGDTLSAGHLGDACPHYAAARSKGLRVKAAAESGTDFTYRDRARDLFDQIDKGEKRAGCAGSSASGNGASGQAGNADAAFAGHYYLSGVMETGSELSLDSDGHFQWFMSYGAEDQAAQGTWHKDGGAIVLAAAMPATDKPLFAYRDTGPWTAGLEQEVLRRTYETAAAVVRANCPFLTDAWVTTPPPAMFDDGTPKLSAAVLRQQAADAMAKAIAARTRVEAFARQVMGTGTSAQDHSASADRAQTLLSDWLDAEQQAKQTADAAGLADPAFAEPALPPACIIPPMDSASDVPAKWTGGIGAGVVDPESEQSVRDVQILLRFVDGHEEKLVTSRSGLAILPGKLPKPVVGATLHADYAQGRDASFTFAPVTNGILHFAIDAQQLARPPFTTLRLTISGKALIPVEFGKGRYERQP